MYNYEIEKPKLFTDEGQRKFLQARDKANQMLDISGAFQGIKPCGGMTGDTWFMIACIDRLVELGEIREVTGKGVAGQHRVFVRT